MALYCITAANHKNSKDDRASEFKLWEYVPDTDDSWGWNLLGRKSLNFVAGLLADGNEVVSAKEIVRDNRITIRKGAAIEISLRIAKNDEQFKITDLPEF